jgi:small subunit ribosomal protein S21
MQVVINNRGHLEMAIRSFRKKTQKEGLVKEARRRKAFEKPSEEKKRRSQESLARTKKSRRKGFTGYTS